MNYSRQREMIYNEIKRSISHPSAFDIYNLLKPEHPSLSLGTVYRNLKVLSDENKIKKLSFLNSPDKFDGCILEHYHYYCIKCGKVYDANDIVATDINKLLSGSNQNITGYELNIYCICENCDNKKAQ